MNRSRDDLHATITRPKLMYPTLVERGVVARQMFIAKSLAAGAFNLPVLQGNLQPVGASYRPITSSAHRSMVRIGDNERAQGHKTNG